MNQEETRNEAADETPRFEETPKTEEIENLPVESIGSYGRIEEIMTDRDSEEGTNPTAQS